MMAKGHTVYGLIVSTDSEERSVQQLPQEEEMGAD